MGDMTAQARYGHKGLAAYTSEVCADPIAIVKIKKFWASLGISGARGGRGGWGAAPPAVGFVEHAGMEAVVAARVLGQVVAAHEALGAEGAGESLLACVCTEVARQLVWSGETLDAARPCALEWSLT